MFSEGGDEMNWLKDNFVAILLAIANIIQALNAYYKNKVDHEDAKQAEVHRYQENSRKDKIELKKLESQALSEQQKLDFELEKLKINGQYNSSQKYIRAQNIFEQYITETLNTISKDEFPYCFSEDHKKLEGLVMFYCPESINTINNFKLFNISFEDSGSTLSKADYIEEAKFRCQSSVYDHLIKELNQKLEQLENK